MDFETKIVVIQMGILAGLMLGSASGMIAMRTRYEPMALRIALTVYLATMMVTIVGGIVYSRIEYGTWR